MDIRIATKNDTDQIALLWEKLDEYNLNTLHLEKEFRNGIVGGRERYKVLLGEMFEQETIIVVSIIENTFVGFIICEVGNHFGNGVQDATIDVTFIDQKFRGQGVATKMYQFLEELLRQKGVVGITTEVFDNNQMSLNFHQKMGFETIAKSVEMYKKL